MKSLTKVTRAPAVRFRPHVHASECVICKAAVDSLQGPPSSLATAKGDSRASSLTKPPLSPSAHATAPVASTAEARREALVRWMALTVTAPGVTLATPTELEAPVSSLTSWLLSSALTTYTARSNAFLPTVLAANDAGKLVEGGVAKQLRFQEALLSFQSTIQNVSGFHRAFLVCGTALSAHREGFFIPHDDDIDIGVFDEDLVAFGDSQTVERDEATSSASDSRAASVSAGVQRLLSDLTCHGEFLAFDICGSVDFGLELRLLHMPTGVRVDVNVYYTSTDEKENDAVNGGRPFTWFATYYEQAEKRAHGMYRYRHTPFQHLLQPILFCSRKLAVEAGPANYHLVPPVSYLEEYFGADWRTPKRYNYVQGLKGEYKNIINE